MDINAVRLDTDSRMGFSILCSKHDTFQKSSKFAYGGRTDRSFKSAVTKQVEYNELQGASTVRSKVVGPHRRRVTVCAVAHSLAQSRKTTRQGARKEGKACRAELAI